MPNPPTVGVLALQGDVREHVRMLAECGARAITVRRIEELHSVDGLVLPGGESTTMIKLAETFDLLDPLRKRLAEGMPTFGTCAGMILLADRIEDGIDGQQTFGGIDMTVRRNAFGRQVDSFESDLEFEELTGRPYHAVFIRAPWVEQVGAEARVLATVAAEGHPHDARNERASGAPPAVTPDPGTIVAVRQGHLLATAFHPELTGDARVHQYFVKLVEEA